MNVATPSLTDLVRTTKTRDAQFVRQFTQEGRTLFDEVAVAVGHEGSDLTGALARLDDLRRATLALVDVTRAGQRAQIQEAARQIQDGEVQGLRPATSERVEGMVLNSFARAEGVQVSRFHDVVRQDDILKHGVVSSEAEVAKLRPAAEVKLPNLRQFADDVVSAMVSVTGLSIGGPVGMTMATHSTQHGEVPEARTGVLDQLEQLKSRLMGACPAGTPPTQIIATRGVRYASYHPANCLRAERPGSPVMWGTTVPRMVYTDRLDGDRVVESLSYPYMEIPVTMEP